MEGRKEKDDLGHYSDNRSKKAHQLWPRGCTTAEGAGAQEVETPLDLPTWTSRSPARSSGCSEGSWGEHKPSSSGPVFRTDHNRWVGEEHAPRGMCCLMDLKEPPSLC